MKADTYTELGVPVVRGTNISDTRAWKGDWVHIPEELAERMKRCLVFAGDLVLPHRGSIGEVAIIPDDERGRYFISSSLMKITLDREKIEPLFCYYFLRSAEGRSEILRFSSSVGTPGIGQPLTSLRQFKVPVPPLPEQRAIAATLGALDDKIELNRKMNATLEAMARALFRDWFVDFGPTRAKAEGRAPYLSPDLWSLFPDRLDAEGKPEGWETGTLSGLVSFNPKEALRKGTEAPYLDMAALPTQGANHAEPTQRAFASGSKFRDGDTLLARITPCLENGKTCLVHGLGQETVAWGSTEFIVMRTRPPLPPAFGYLLARDEDFRSAAIRSMTGTSGRQRATVDAIANRPFTVPPQEIMFAFGACVNALFERIARNERESRTLAQTRDLLLPKLMSGEFRVTETETEQPVAIKA
ncbi:restriction endonuclease subunit S [Rhodovulum strictum]|uniref:Restriction endonuclease subunit S n=1 Tax=Rhodovulum strictum TaxID=58314 RepID=A0A844B8G5_9RHOB|nr:restriction endonuclease subunit S [Rhodovulum strictum]MRH21910.1 restriction endonuclease subunit S [Rhodovulum strictum]